MAPRHAQHAATQTPHMNRARGYLMFKTLFEVFGYDFDIIAVTEVCGFQILHFTKTGNIAVHLADNEVELCIAHQLSMHPNALVHTIQSEYHCVTIIPRSFGHFLHREQLHFLFHFSGLLATYDDDLVACDCCTAGWTLTLSETQALADAVRAEPVQAVAYNHRLLDTTYSVSPRYSTDVCVYALGSHCIPITSSRT